MYADYEDPKMEEIEQLNDKIYELSFTNIDGVNDSETLKELSSELKSTYYELRDKVCTLVNSSEESSDTRFIKTNYDKATSQYRKKIKQLSDKRKALGEDNVTELTFSKISAAVSNKERCQQYVDEIPDPNAVDENIVENPNFV